MKKALLIFFNLLFIHAISFCQPFYTLQDAISTAIKNNFDVKLAKNNVQIATIENSKSFAGALPTITGSLSDNEQIQTLQQKFSDETKNIKKDNVASNVFAANITGSILLYNGMRLVATEKKLALLKKQSETQLNQQIQSLIAAVCIQYYDVVRQQSYLKTINQSITVAKEKLAIIKRRKEIGMANDADLFQAQIDVNALLQQLQQQNSSITQSKIALEALLIIPPDTNINIKDTIVVDNALQLNTIKEGIKKNPDIQNTKEQIEILKLAEQETAALRYPSIRANTGYSFSNNKTSAGFSQLNQNYGPFLGASLSIPIYNGGLLKKQQQIAEINTQNAKLASANTQFNAEVNATKNYELYESSLKQLATEKENYLLSEKLLKLILNKFQLGQATIVDVKIAQQSFEAESYRLVNLSYTAKTAEIQLKKIGSLLVL